MEKDKVKPYSPADARKHWAELEKERLEAIPDKVIETFNRRLGEAAMTSVIVMYQHDVVAELEEKGLKREEIQKKRWLEIAPLYRAAGWAVDYRDTTLNVGDPARYKFSVPRPPSMD
jgi:hypothetical protein